MKDINALPYNKLAEKKVLGTVLLDSTYFWQAAEKLKPEDFYTSSYKLLYSSMLELSREGITDFNSVTLSNYLKSVKKLEEFGGIKAFSDILSDLQFGVVTSTDIDDAINIILKHSIERKRIKLASKLTSDLLSGDNVAASGTEKQLLELGYDLNKDYINTPDSFSYPVLQKVFEIGKLKQKVIGLRTGFKDFDYLTTGLAPENLVVIGARPSVGKTTMSLNMATYLTIEQDKVVCFFSLEMSKEELIKKVWASYGRVPLQKIRTGLLDFSEWARVYSINKKLNKAKLYIDDDPTSTTISIEAAVQKIILKEGKVDLIVVDYLQLMKSVGRYDSRQLEVSSISREFKILAKKLGIPIVLISQLNRKPSETKFTRKPQLSDLRDSGAVEQDADIVVLLHRDDEVDRDSGVFLMEMLLEKQRNGATGAIPILYNPRITRFENVFF